MAPPPGSLPGPLTGLRVVDLTQVLSGPYATMLLADLGAEVIKVERPGEGDGTRHFPPLDRGQSHYFMSINRNKRGICVDLKDPRGRQLILDLAAKSDVLVENFRPGVVERLGLDYDTVSAVNPAIIYCSISGFGQTGPWAQRSAFDVAIQALSGAMSVNGHPDSPPVRLGLPMGDLSGGLFGAIGALAALVERGRTGRGRHVDVSMLDSMVGLLVYLGGHYLMTGEEPGRTGPGHHSIVPYGTFDASDGHIVVAILTEPFWTKLCHAMDRPDLAASKELDTNAKRLERRDQVNGLVQGEIGKRTVAEWVARFEAADVPHAPILSIGDALNHPQIAARGMIQEVDHPLLGRVKVTGKPIRFVGEDEAALLPPPLRGQHTMEVLGDVLGYSEETVQNLAQAGVVELADPPLPP